MLAFGVRESVASPGTVATGGTLTLVAEASYPRFQNIPAYWSGAAVRCSFPFSVIDINGAPLAHGVGRLTAASTLTVDRWLQSYVVSTYDDTSVTSVALGTSTVFVIGTAGPWSFPVLPTALISDTTANPITFKRLRVSGHIAAMVSSFTMAANTLYFTPFRLEYGGELTGIGIGIITAASGKSIRFGIYAADSFGKPGVLLAETSALSVGVAGDVSGSVSSISIPPGAYWVGIISDGAPSIRSGTIGDFQAPGFADWGFTGRIIARTLYYSYTFGALPANGPTMISMTADMAPYTASHSPVPVLEFSS
jgi:hypothetical protein